MSWDPTQYLKFAGERLRPAIDLLARVPLVAPTAVVDLGCGAGNLTPLMQQRWPQAKHIGVDSSATMLAKARQDYPTAEFVEGDIATWLPAEPVDLIYSNAAIQWLDGHDTLIPGLLQGLKPGGWLAIQMPRNYGAPSHTSIVDTIELGPWRARLEPHLRRRPVAEPQAYWRMLHERCAVLDIWESEYLQVLSGANPVAEFTKGTALKPFLDMLDEPERSAFEADYRNRIANAYQREADGRTLFPFRRLFILAQKPL
ncbi:methyltransferase domain-containing protein [Ferrovibrio sp.]|uniref:methyltransferase domain-containing protein n=1 Tax=Ferrovibrio sp. TaxID=1917215 RepID=UPI000CB48671|nr:methyltransferase domain-containing protein [Ferrovibrio sp.]PJI40183.1 MAG: trans-aconitate 2-methyltransferase [Ferrovibrio sp.]